MTQIPRSALLLGLAGLIPFLWGALTVLSPAAANWGISTFGPRFIGPYVQLFYGAIILSFMSGVLWGFAAKPGGRGATMGYALSVIPALWAFLMTGSGPVSAGINLMVGFVGLLALDWHFWRNGMAPAWWMQLRILLTGIVIISFIPVIG
jgi:hypothetical protein